ncbi:LCP family protein [Dellaglioa algida]|uniref:LytR family transcriptional regulator n=1 Tax=Dellaglioa algida TaxID=105612 RepID=A0A5C6MDZ5_9LACO|nr:LCP family protein [Dellaglioa algida]MDK1717128.1 LCP family protein [Dellaglioa algida]MDK1719802.1 LCP family protein [Dellaglioa algida]MDK1722070.1 LCP family protein [Dellaglioa algida]MDK1723145.1 LCP family protein [Dellaglioa algida]MDK1739903.1 LCP family protein [Dellaglioa algida]
MDEDKSQQQGSHKKHRHHKKKRMSTPKKWGIGVGVVIAILLVIGGGLMAKVYLDAKDVVDNTYQKVNVKNKRTTGTVSLKKEAPFSVLILGVDTGEDGRTDQGRSDTMMVATINPKTNMTTLTSLPRDTKIPITGHGTENKLNAAYAYGDVSLAMDTIQNYLNIPIDYYVQMNMKGLEELTGAVGPITVDNPFAFDDYAKGEIELNEENVLAFSRMRHNDPNGDYGRQKRQRSVVTALGKNIASINGVTKYQSILNALETNMKTDLKFEDIKAIATKYRSAIGTIKNIQLQGQSQMINDTSYEVVPMGQVTKVSNMIRKQLELD